MEKIKEWIGRRNNIYDNVIVCNKYNLFCIFFAVPIVERGIYIILLKYDKKKSRWE